MNKLKGKWTCKWKGNEHVKTSVFNYLRPHSCNVVKSMVNFEHICEWAPETNTTCTTVMNVMFNPNSIYLCSLEI